MIFEFLHPSLILPVFFLSPPSLCIFFFSSLWTAYCGILKVHSRVLSCPLLPSMHRSNLELLSAQDGRTLLMSGGRSSRRYDAALCTPWYGFIAPPPLLSSIWKAPTLFFFLPFPFLSAWLWNCINKSGKKNWKHCCEQWASALSWCDPDSLQQARAASVC